MTLETLDGAKRLRESLAERLDATARSIASTRDTWRIVMMRANIKELDRLITALESEQQAVH